MREMQSFLKRPRYLRAIPSLVVLTTAMAWAALPELDDREGVGKPVATSVLQITGSPQGGLPGRSPGSA